MSTDAPRMGRVQPQRRFRGWRSRSWPIRIRFALLLPVDSRWNAWVRDGTAWLERGSS